MLSAPPSPVGLALLAAAAATFLPGCSRDGRSGKLVLPADGGVQESGLDPALRIVLAATSLRREPSDQVRVKLDGAKGTAANVVALLPRGERVTLLEGREGWSRVRVSGGEEGWLRSASVSPASETQEATVLEVAWAFDRPDLLAVNARRKLEPGVLLFVRKSKDLFT
jgi:SH3-like domain-containing protein